ncbi:hypothetical protein AAFC00_000873 [Neodothiora populina]|uniref:IEC3 subunit of the Ino80 complex, chromatin re-modelling-domain-containing protein n=1 Tax=Neodothiora populina TaxID=2781224 RepID=A0ABR3PMA9_9PEZI
MSDDEHIVAGAPDATIEDLDPPAHKPKYKSWRKKYRKMKTHFDQVLKDNNSLFVEEQKLETLNKRLQEQNDQLLDILLDLNDSLNLPRSLRYDLTFTRDRTTEYDGYDLSQANAEIIDVHNAVQTGDCPQPMYQQFRTELEQTLSRRGVRRLEDLEDAIPHPVADEAADVDAVLQPEYLTTAQQDAYLLAMDAQSGDTWALTQTLPTPPVKFAEMTSRELEREIELRNPHSVHSWLKKHKREHEAADDAASEAAAAAQATTPATGRKRGTNLAKKMGDRAVNRARHSAVAGSSTAAAGPAGAGADDAGSPASNASRLLDGDSMLDDDADFDSPPASVSASSRKKGGDKDDTYRPKGGSSKKAKRKREGDSEGGTATKGKKARTSAAASLAAAAGEK